MNQKQAIDLIKKLNKKLKHFDNKPECSRCGIAKKRKKFTRGDCYCKKCRKEYNKFWRQVRKEMQTN